MQDRRLTVCSMSNQMILAREQLSAAGEGAAEVLGRSGTGRRSATRRWGQGRTGPGMVPEVVAGDVVRSMVIWEELGRVWVWVWWVAVQGLLVGRGAWVARLRWGVGVLEMRWEVPAAHVCHATGGARRAAPAEVESGGAVRILRRNGRDCEDGETQTRRVELAHPAW
jgi:hypothetical protein